MMNEDQVRDAYQRLQEQNTDLGNRALDSDQKIELHKIRAVIFIGQCLVQAARIIANAIYAIVPR